MSYFLPERQGLYSPEHEKDSCGVGFVCNINGERTSRVILQGLYVLERLAHRGAVGADPKTGDGAGILMQMPHEFMSHAAEQCKLNLPAPGQYGAGLVFLPQAAAARELCVKIFEKTVKENGHVLLGWRDVPVALDQIGVKAKETAPIFKHVFIARGKNVKSEMDFERQLYIIRKKIEIAVSSEFKNNKVFFYITGLSCRTLNYKGLLMPDQVRKFFDDLRDERMVSALALVHSRYSTNTFPTWDLSQPFRFLAHNGEINTLRGNINWMKARESLLESKHLGTELKHIKPIIVPGGSDSAALDNVFELLYLSGRPIEHVMMMLIPGAWHNNRSLTKKMKDFYRYHSCLTEPWDGPAALAVTDGTKIVAGLDRNGLRPARYIVTHEGLVVMSSEVGVLHVNAGKIAHSGRLEPGKMLLIDTAEKRIVTDEELKKTISSKKPYSDWLKAHLKDLSSISTEDKPEHCNGDLLQLLRAFGYTREDIKVILQPMLEKGKEPIGSMGNDTPHAVLSKKHSLLYAYFKQLFAQVTNPPVDPIRESIVMSIETCIGPEKNILEESPEHCEKLLIKDPILTDKEMAKIKGMHKGTFKTKIVSILFDPNDKAGFGRALKNICREAEDAINKGFTFIVLSDRNINEKLAAIPALLAVGAVHHHLVKESLRTRIGIIVESAEPREVHHFALLFGYGADCINPYLAYAACDMIIKENGLGLTTQEGRANYKEAVCGGILKILSKMGISTLQSYRGAQIFEAVGLGQDVIETAFSGTASRIGGASLDIVRDEAIMRHKEGFTEKENSTPYLSTGGLYQWKKDGESHLWNPDTIALLQDSTRTGDYKKYREFSGLITDQSKYPTTLRSLLKFVPGKPVSIDEVEPAESIYKRLATGAMSFGSISRGAHETLALAMNKLGGKSNTGEGGEDPARFVPLPDGGSKRSAIKQVASGRFGVTTNYLVNADEIQIKMAQGAKPGEGGQLPGHKVSEIIAKTRYTTEGVTLISPPPHHDIYSIEDLAQLIFDLKNVNPDARISVKLVSEIGIGTIAAGVAKGHADMILISGGDGGTGASPLSSIKHAGLPWELGLSETHQTLVLNDLRSRVRLQTDGQMRTGTDIAIAAMLGAEEYGFCTAALIVMGCVMLRHCHLNNCSVGVATQDEVLQKRFSGQMDHVMNYFRFVVRELREIMANLGVKTMDELIGRTDLLAFNKDIAPWKAGSLDYSRILHRPAVKDRTSCYCTRKQHHGVDKVMDTVLIRLTKQALENKEHVKLDMAIDNTNRSAGAMLSGRVCKLYGENALPDDTIHIKFEGNAGQSFGAWLAKGITFELEGMANDYVGKGISGGRIIVYPSRRADYKPDENIIIGNTTFYGAISGEAYIKGVAGERFCIRNSGLKAVVEGVGDHGCEYMTGGCAVILGKTGRNFGAGMSGGVAYVYDEMGDFRDKCNMEMIDLEKLNKQDIETVSKMLNTHYKYTGSQKARMVLDNMSVYIGKFIKVMPTEYKKILEGIKAKAAAANGDVSDG